MPIRPTSRSTSRAGVLTAAAGAALLLLAPAASAAPAITIPLDPKDVVAFPIPVENVPNLDALVSDDGYAPVDVAWNGSVTVDLPSAFDASTAVVTLALSSAPDDEPSLVYTSDGSLGSPLVVSRASDSVTVTLPADTTTDGPYALLEVDPPATDDSTPLLLLPVYYELDFNLSAAAAATLHPTLYAMDSVPCSLFDEECDPYEVTAGDELALTLPKGSLLRSLGFTSLDGALVGMGNEDEDEDGDWSESAESSGSDVTDLGLLADSSSGSISDTAGTLSVAEALDELREAFSSFGGAIDLTGTAAGATTTGTARAETTDEIETSGGVLGYSSEDITDAGGTVLDLSGTSSRVTTTLPDDLDAGRYGVVVQQTSAEGGQAVTFFELDVAKPVVETASNDGLSSATGWNDAQPPTGSWPLIALGATALALAGGGSVLALRRGR